MPTAVPGVAASDTWFAATLLSLTGPTGSFTGSTLMVNVAWLVEASLEVARTDTEWLVAVS